MYRFNNTILITLVGWFAGTSLYAFYCVASVAAQPDLAVYERGGFLALFSFALYQLPYLLIGLVIILVVECLFFLYQAVKDLQSSNGNRKHS
jgi:hypothetical protein